MAKVSTPELVREAAYRCFCRHGYRRTTVSDIVEESQLSRPTVYKYAGSKEEAVVDVVRSVLDQALRTARGEAETAESAEQKILAVLTVKLEVAIRLWRDSPAHAQELLSTAGSLAPEVITGYQDGLTDLLVAAFGPEDPVSARQAANVLLTFTRGLEDDLRDADAARRDLASGVRMIWRGAFTPTGRPPS